MLLMKGILKLSDIGHASKDLKLHLNWTQRITDEFYNQGDAEREMGVPISPFCDRQNANLPTSQIGFFNFLVIPLANVLADFFQHEKFEVVRKQLQDNLQHWIAMKMMHADMNMSQFCIACGDMTPGDVR